MRQLKSYILAFVVLSLAMDAAKALQCFQCDYLEGKGKDDDMGKRFHESCRNGRTPHQKLFVTCPIVSDVCLKIVAEGKDDNGRNVTYTTRGCGIRKHFEGFEIDKCEDKNSTELIHLLGYELPLQGNLTGNVCLCSENKCNSSSMLKVTQSLVFTTLGLLCYKLMAMY